MTRLQELDTPTLVLLALGVLVATLIVAALAAALLRLLHHAASETLRRSRPYREATAALLADPRVVALLGEPIEFGDPWGGIEVTPLHSRVDLDVPVCGPKGRGSLRLRERRWFGWRRKETLLHSSSGQTIDLDPRKSGAS